MTPLSNMPQNRFSAQCRQCARLAAFLDEVRRQHPDYYCRPVPPFGDSAARLLVVGLAPGKHGANASGRPFTGDYAGELLYRTLHRYGFASAAESRHAADGLELSNCRITNAVKCLPPANKPTVEEVVQCNRFLAMELEQQGLQVVLALGQLAHRAVLRARDLVQNRYAFGHNRRHDLPGGLVLVDSYHCSRYNTQTRRLTESMFDDVFDQVSGLLGNGE